MPRKELPRCDERRDAKQVEACHSAVQHTPLMNAAHAQPTPSETAAAASRRRNIHIVYHTLKESFMRTLLRVRTVNDELTYAAAHHHENRRRRHIELVMAPPPSFPRWYDCAPAEVARREVRDERRDAPPPLFDCCRAKSPRVCYAKDYSGALRERKMRAYVFSSCAWRACRYASPIEVAAFAPARYARRLLCRHRRRSAIRRRRAFRRM